MARPRADNRYARIWEELVRAIGLALRAGARRPLVITAFEDASVQATGVADGYALGVAAADLLHKHLTTPNLAPRFIGLFCQVHGAGAAPLGLRHPPLTSGRRSRE